MSFILGFLLDAEGGYCNDKNDPGGATKYGIDQRSHPNVNIKSLTISRATDIYWNSYWNNNNIEQYPYPLGEAYFDCCVNCGKSRADDLLLRASSNYDSFLEARENFYRSLAKNKPSSSCFLQGWLNRINNLREFLK